MEKRPNVLVLLCDQMQHHRMGFVDGISHTPNLDALAADGIHFSNAFTVQAQCVPARAVLQTGLYAHECGVVVNYGDGFFGHQNRLGPQHGTLGHAFRNAGYRTAYFGKSHLGLPLDQLGYEISWNNDGIRISDNEAEALGLSHVPRILRCEYQACDRAVEFLRRYQPDDKPLFFTFSTNLPHPPFFTEPDYEQLFDAGNLPLPESYYKETLEGKPPYQYKHAHDGHHGAGSESETREMLKQYLTVIAKTDEHFGRVINEFKRLGLWDNTLVLFVADHGDMMGAHGMTVKGTLPYDEIYRIPLIIRLPENSSLRGKTIDTIVSNERLPATLLRLADVPVPESYRHGDFCEVIEGREPEAGEVVFFEHYAAYWGVHPFYGIRTRDYKYIYYYGPDQTEEMYDLRHDPHELTNVVDDPAYAQIEDELVSRAHEWWQQTDGRDFEYYESDWFKQNRHNSR